MTSSIHNPYLVKVSTKREEVKCTLKNGQRCLWMTLEDMNQSIRGFYLSRIPIGKYVNNTAYRRLLLSDHLLTTNMHIRVIWISDKSYQMIILQILRILLSPQKTILLSLLEEVWLGYNLFQTNT